MQKKERIAKLLLVVGLLGSFIFAESCETHGLMTFAVAEGLSLLCLYKGAKMANKYIND